MYTREISNEAEIVHAIIVEEFPGLNTCTIGKIERGISNLKYWLKTEEGSYVVKVFPGRDHRRRALVEHGLLSRLHAQAVVPVPEPVACITAESSLPYSYVVMSRVDGTPLDEMIQLLGDEEAEPLGAAMGVLLSELHRLDPAICDTLVPTIDTARPAKSDRQMVFEAEDLGVLTRAEGRRFLELHSALLSQPGTRVLIHGDLGLDNIIMASEREPHVAALIDFEYCTVSHAAFDFAKVSVGSSRQTKVFAESLRVSYLGAVGASAPEAANFSQQIVRCEMMSDLRVAMDLARGSFHYLHSLATTEHQAWQQVGRLYRILREGCSRSATEMAGISARGVMLKAWELSRTSSCKVRRVGALIIDDEGSVVSSGINELRPTAAACWCATTEPGSQRPKCPAIHAEQNAIEAASERGNSLRGLTMFCSTCPCAECARWIVRAGLSAVFYTEDYIDVKGLDYLLASGVAVRRVDLADL